MGKFFRNSDGELNVQVIVALIAAMATLSAALITGFFGLIQMRAASAQPPTSIPFPTVAPTLTAEPTETPRPTATVTPAPTTAPTATAAPLALEIEGPTEALLNELTFFTIISENAVRARWSIGGFANNQVFDVDPLPASYEIEVEPTNAERIGDAFTLVVTVFDENGRSITAQHRFEVVEEE
jgi:hypothetical protein